MVVSSGSYDGDDDDVLFYVFVCLADFASSPPNGQFQ